MVWKASLTVLHTEQAVPRGWTAEAVTGMIFCRIEFDSVQNFRWGRVEADGVLIWIVQ